MKTVRYNLRMKRTLCMIALALTALLPVSAQERKVENRPYTDLRRFHFGVLVGAHLQDIELLNVGPKQYVMEDGSTAERTVTVDQDRWDPGFIVGVLGEARLSQTFQLRIAPALFFGTRHLTFHNLSVPDANGQPTEQRQELKTAYVSCAFDLIAAAPRFNNHRPYVVAGINPMLNLSGKDDDIIKLKGTDTFLEIGVGCDFYLPYFKLRPELKFMYGLSNCLDTKHGSNMRDANLRPYAMSVSEAHAKIIALTFYFE